MPITVHSSSPSLVSGNAVSVTTGSFSPPAGSLLVACQMTKYDSTMTLSNTGSALSWTQRVTQINTNGIAAIYTAPAISQFMTITGTLDFFGGGTTAAMALKIYVLAGADMTQPIGTTGSTNSSGVQNWTFSAYTSTAADSLGICAASDDYQTSTPASTDVAESFNVSASSGSNWLSGMSIRKAATTPVPGTSVTFDIQSGEASASTRWAVAAVEIRAAATPSPQRPLIPAGAVHRAGAW
ncbi:hypothetical protein [Streptosporangium saharense]|uniref:hypothetical protein n=1 Tax=Streptosporangium saharense TaxID=1706840 RepID=UPI003415CA1D